MENKNSYDVRGSQSRIFRLFCFDKEGLVHMTFYRIAIFVAILLVASMAVGVVYAKTPFINSTRVLIALLWILFTPQLFETVKAMAVIASSGIVFGRLNESFMKYGVKKNSSYAILGVLPYLVLMVWAIGLLGVIKLWFI